MGGGLNGRSDAPGRSLAKHALVVRVESLVGDKLTPTLSVPVLGGRLMLSNRKGWLSEVCTSPSSQSTTKHKHSSILVGQGHFQTTFLPRLAVQVRGASPGERHRAATWWRGAASREELYRSPHDLAHARPSSLALSTSHKSHHPSRRQEGEGLAGAAVWNKTLSIPRSGWNDPALKVGKPIFLKRVRHPVFPLLEPRARSV